MPSTPPHRRGNNKNKAKGRGNRQIHLNFAPPPIADDIPPEIPVELHPTTRRAPEPAPEIARRGIKR